MLRLYKPIEHDDIFELNSILEHLVCDIWCQADDEDWIYKNDNIKLKTLCKYKIFTGITFKSEINRIYGIFKLLKKSERRKIKKAWNINKKIRQLCTKKVKPRYLKDLNKTLKIDVVENDIKPLFEKCYEDLLNKKGVSGDKLEYYKRLIILNDFDVCPCCGMSDFELEDSEYREAYDHYLPKSIYPFVSVNFKNLVPICYKCNSDRKDRKNPIEKERVTFYPFSNSTKHEILIHLLIDETKDLDKLKKEDIKIMYEGKDKEIETWDWLFDISKRYNNKVKKYSKSMLKRLKSRHKTNLKLKEDTTYQETIDFMIKEYSEEKYTDKNFLRIPLLEVIKNRQDMLDVYDN